MAKGDNNKPETEGNVHTHAHTHMNNKEKEDDKENDKEKDKKQSLEEFIQPLPQEAQLMILLLFDFLLLIKVILEVLRITKVPGEIKKIIDKLKEDIQTHQKLPVEKKENRNTSNSASDLEMGSILDEIKKNIKEYIKHHPDIQKADTKEILETAFKDVPKPIKPIITTFIENMIEKLGQDKKNQEIQDKQENISLAKDPTKKIIKHSSQEVLDHQKNTTSISGENLIEQPTNLNSQKTKENPNRKLQPWMRKSFYKPGNSDKKAVLEKQKNNNRQKTLSKELPEQKPLRPRRTI